LAQWNQSALISALARGGASIGIGASAPVRSWIGSTPRDDGFDCHEIAKAEFRQQPEFVLQKK
jgi:hypothetical protein